MPILLFGVGSIAGLFGYRKFKEEKNDIAQIVYEHGKKDITNYIIAGLLIYVIYKEFA